MSVKVFRLRGPTDCPGGQVYDYTTGMCRPAITDQPVTLNPAVTAAAVTGVGLITILGIATTVAAGYFVYRVAKKQRWI